MIGNQINIHDNDYNNIYQDQMEQKLYSQVLKYSSTDERHP